MTPEQEIFAARAIKDQRPFAFDWITNSGLPAHLGYRLQHGEEIMFTPLVAVGLLEGLDCHSDNFVKRLSWRPGFGWVRVAWISDMTLEDALVVPGQLNRFVDGTVERVLLRPLTALERGSVLSRVQAWEARGPSLD